jgi:diacylglycerol kinase (ATP)
VSDAKRSATLIFNPNAGFDDWRRRIDEVVDFWCDRGWEVTLRTTEGPGHATELAQAAAASGHRLVLAAGGDGTLHETANGLIHTASTLAPLPAGTTNCLARDLKLPQPNGGSSPWLIDASKALLAGSIQRMDAGQCSNGKHWLLWAGVGIESRIVEAVEPRSPMLKRLGLAGYVAKATPAFLTYVGSRLRVTVDRYTVSDDFISVTVANSRLFAGGLYNLNPHGVLDDGKFEVWMMRGRFSPRMMWHGLALAQGKHERRPDVVRLKGRHVSIESASPQAFHLDGEINRSTPMTCTLLPGALRILAPNTAPGDLFSQPGEPL